MLLLLRSSALPAPALLILGALDSNAVAQTPGSHNVRAACTIPAPVGSLLPTEASARRAQRSRGYK